MSETIARPLHYRTALRLYGRACAQPLPIDFSKESRTLVVYGAPITSSDALFDNAYGRINSIVDPVEAPLYHICDDAITDDAVLALFGGRQKNLGLHIVHVLQALHWLASPQGADDLPLGAGGDQVRLISYVPTYMGQFQKTLAIWDPDSQGFRLHTLKWGKGPESIGLERWSSRTYLLTGTPASA